MFCQQAANWPSSFEDVSNKYILALPQISKSGRTKVDFGLIIAHNGDVVSYTAAKDEIPSDLTIDSRVNTLVKVGLTPMAALRHTMQALALEYGFELRGDGYE